MKSSTRNPLNPHLLGTEKRFDALVKKQTVEHEHVISSHNKEMQELRDLIKLSMERFNSLFGHAESEMKVLSLFLNEQIISLKEKVAGNEMRISEQRKTIEALHEQLLAFHTSYSSKNDADKFKREVAEQINHATTSHINSYQECERTLKGLFYSLQEDLIKLSSEIDQKISQLSDKSESNFYVSRLDKEGVLKQIRIYEKTIFIMEKKIENIYTLIERINKRGEACHKPE